MLMHHTGAAPRMWCDRVAYGRDTTSTPAPAKPALVQQGRSYRLVGRGDGLSKNAIEDIIKRNQI
jgi:hypothetical protein